MLQLRNLEGRFAGVNGLDGDVYYQLNGSELVVYGFNGETEVPTGAWEKKAGYFNKTKDSKDADTGLYDALIDGLYDMETPNNPEQHMFWPIFNDTMTNSQGYIKNDYGYESIN